MSGLLDRIAGVDWASLLWPGEIDRWAHPLAALALLLVPLLIVRWSLARRAAAPYPGTHRAAAAPRTLRAATPWLPHALRLLAVGLLIVAAARPQSAEGQTREKTEGIAIQLVIDRSSSMNQAMLLDGRSVTRFAAVKQVVSEFVAGDGKRLGGRAGDLIGLIAFAGFADTVAPLVRDHAALVELIEPLQTAGRVNQEDGTNIGDALALAVARLRRAEREVAAAAGADPAADPDFEIKSKVIILLTDGENNRGQVDPLTAARLAADLGIRIYTVGVGEQSRIINFGGIPVRQPSGVDEGLLGTIAEATGGRFFMASDAEALRQIYATIDELETTEIETSELTRYEEEFAPFAVWALALLVLEAALRTLVYRRLP